MNTLTSPMPPVPRDPRADLDDLFRAISHDLRAPVRHLGAFGQMLRERLDELGGDAEALACMDAMNEATRNLGRMIDGVQDLSRIARVPLMPQPLDLRALIDEARERVAPGGTGHAIDWRISDGFPPAEGDAALVRELLERLLSNAVKFTRREPAAWIAVEWQRDQAGAVEYSVRDNGVGFAATGAARLFGLFERLHPLSDFEGLGVGLAGARQIVERHGGQIAAESAPQAGCTVRFTLAQVQGGPRDLPGRAP